MLNIQEKFMIAKKEMAEALVDREAEIDMLFTAVLAKTNLLLIGPPGTGKSLLLDSFMRLINGKKFSLLMTKFTTPEEVFGPISLKGLENDHYRRITTDRLPEAHVAFLDEIFKSNSAILNTLLKILNEGVFENDGVAHKVPLELCVAASNEKPDPETAKELGALFDRFLLRKVVTPVRKTKDLEKLLWQRDHNPKFSISISIEELTEARKLVSKVEWTKEAKECYLEIIKGLAKEGVCPGDRRKFRCVDVIQSWAWLNGKNQVTPDDFDIACYVLWDDFGEQERICANIILEKAKPLRMAVADMLLEFDEIVSDIDKSDSTSLTRANKKLESLIDKIEFMPANPKLEWLLAEIKKQKIEIKDAMTKLIVGKKK